MCGILVGFGPDINLISRDCFNSSLNLMNHRGPDNCDYFLDDNCFLGHVRLSIIDTSNAASQPYFHNQYVLVFNGEIFNYIEIRETLKKVGYNFTTNSDTEVLIKAYDYFGSECFNLFNGMWSLVIYNRETKELLISRDRFGQKPLFIAQNGNDYYFCSEIRPLLNFVPVEKNYSAIISFLREADFNVNNNTFFKNIFEYPTATITTISGDFVLKEWQFWRYPEVVMAENGDFAYFEKLLHDSVKIRLRSDVEYSMLLSGGCDSTIIAGIMRDIVGSEAGLSAFNYSSRDQFDESKFADRIASILNIELHHGFQESSAVDFLKRLRVLVGHLGRGHGSPAIISVDYLYEKLRALGFRVTIDGQGADELLAGYDHYHYPLLMDAVVNLKFRLLIDVCKDLFNKGVLKVTFVTLRIYSPPVIRKILRSIYGYERFFNPKFKDKIQDPILNSGVSNLKKQNILNKYLINQHKTGLKNLLFYGDIIAMKNSVENRSPFMDHRLVEYSFKHGNNIKYSNGLNKAVLKQHPWYMKFKGDLDRPKVGFSSLIPSEIKSQMVNELKSSSILKYEILSCDVVEEFLNNEKSLSKKYEPFLFRLYQVHLWDSIYNKG